MRAQGLSWRQTADKLGVGVGTVRAISDSPVPEADQAATDALDACQNYAKTY